MSKVAKPQHPKLKASEKANLTTNVNNVSKSLKTYYASKDIDITKLKGGQFAFAALLESFTRLIVEQCKKTVGKSKSNLLELTRASMNNSLLLNKDFKTYFVASIEDYKENGVYSNVIPMTPKEMDEILGEFQNVSLSQDAKNYMHFLLSKVYVDVASTCAVLCTYAKKKSLDGLCVTSALKLLLGKQLYEPLIASVNLAMKLSGRDLEAKEGDDKESETEETHEGGDFEDGNEDNEDEQEAKSSDKKKPLAKAAQQPKGPTKGNTVATTKGGKKPTETSDAKPTTKNGKGKQQIQVSDDEEEPEDEPEDQEEEKKPAKKASKKASVGNKSNNKKT